MRWHRDRGSDPDKAFSPSSSDCMLVGNTSPDRVPDNLFRCRFRCLHTPTWTAGEAFMHAQTHTRALTH
jgi:hypothetical protein